MLRLADELREERVQMKLLEARLQFEEKNAVVEQLRGELEAFLETKKHGLLLELASPAAADEEYHQATHDVDHHGFFEAEGADGTARVDVGKRTDVDDDGDDSNGSDMHSIEPEHGRQEQGLRRLELQRHSFQGGDGNDGQEGGVCGQQGNAL
ncbi:hypothetical protein D1007_47662 [Hordeum vulgare]|nr:hypothetical protein D1007_47662 [Hordeum vulgare]